MTNLTFLGELKTCTGARISSLNSMEQEKHRDRILRSSDHALLNPMLM